MNRGLSNITTARVVVEYSPGGNELSDFAAAQFNLVYLRNLLN